MGMVHALHIAEIARETGKCRLAAIADSDAARARNAADRLGLDVPRFESVDALAASGAADATFVVTPTECHREHAATLAAAGQRVLLEKPLTGTLPGDREFCAVLDRDHPNAVMLAFQRRFDAPLRYARQLMADGIVGRVFKVYSALEDSNPAPDGYQSDGILPDMSVHNVDEILWLTGKVPRTAAAAGFRIYSSELTTCREDFDDALLLFWFADRTVAQVQVSRNHVSGYRVVTIIFGTEGQIRIGRFDQRPRDITVEAYGRRGAADPLAHRVFTMRDYGPGLPEFVDRFGPAYKAELEEFIERCLSGAPFSSTHRDGLAAQEVISAGMQAVIGEEQGAHVGG
jgi:myo-inositol 2-dehydrogenase/D-chiro-inositol 1-dehydrogenase